ncbi:alpha/beta hydrolase [Sphingomonas sp. RB1R13]|uniref:alpha/beta hydrolase n=1 Tax=Sphingomonas sp. RB1R13 TaxID=3096159 RepID=UPI002FCB98C8
MTEPYIRPDVKLLLQLMAASGQPPIEAMSPTDARAMRKASKVETEPPLGELGLIRDLSCPGPAGAIALRLFDVRAERSPSDVIMFTHGGGFVFGDLDSHASVCAEISRQMDLPVISVDYRLAPEAPFPAAPDDALAAARWIAANGAATGREAKRLILMGDSAGANLAIVTAVALRDAPAAVPVAATCLVYPVTETCRNEGSGHDFAEGYFLTQAGMHWFDSHYRAPDDDPRRNPLVAGLAGLPPTVIITASLDPLRDQGRSLAGELARVGCEVVYLEARGTIHAFWTLRKLLPSSAADVAQTLAHLKLMVAA